MNKEQLLNLFFETLLRGTWSAGGDGLGLFICRYDDYKEVANLFKEYEVIFADNSKGKVKDIYQVHEENDKGLILFTDGSNENIIISNSNPYENYIYFDIVIKY